VRRTKNFRKSAEAAFMKAARRWDGGIFPIPAVKGESIRVNRMRKSVKLTLTK